LTCCSSCSSFLIITIPVQRPKLPINLPPPSESSIPLVTHRLTLAADGTMGWDGTAITEARLSERLAKLTTDPAQPFLEL
jgi:biopolymer transport protein ExbD